MLMNSEPVLSVRDLSVGFTAEDGYTDAVKSVSFDLYPGRTLGLVGESGSGKSVTALSVMRLLTGSSAVVRSGRVLFKHPVKGVTDLLKISAGEMQKIRGRHMGMIFQEPMTSLNPVKRCGWQVSEVLLQHTTLSARSVRERTIELFREVMLPYPEEVCKSWPHQLSGGQKQRVMIAMAMACDPGILIADEPTTALDVTVQRSILELIKTLQQKHGSAVLFISHDLGVIREVAHRVSVMRNGVILEDGTSGDVFDNPRQPYTRALLACRPPVDKRPSRLAVVGDFETVGGSNGKHEQHAPSWHGIYDSNEAVLEVKGLQTYFAKRRDVFGRVTEYHRAVENISFTLYRGETLGLVGESGCGKTTLGRSIMRLINARSGRVIFRGKDLNKLSGRELRLLRPRFQIIFQDPYASLTPGMSVGRAIMEPMRVHGILRSKKERSEHIINLLEKVGLEQRHYYRYPHELSGGQRQRVCIARALALGPEFIIFDESVSALDVSVQAQVLNLLNELKKELGLTYIFISHDLGVVKYMSDRIMVMRGGKMEEFGDADQLCLNPGSEYTRSLLDALPGF